MHSGHRAVLAALALSLLAPCGAIAQKYPSRPVRIVVGFAPGGATDIAARAIAQKLADTLGGSFIVDNRPGAAGNIGAEIVARANPDGHTLLMANSTIAIPALFARLPFDIRKDFLPVSLIAIGPSVLAAHSALPANDVKGLIAHAKSHPKQLSYGSGGAGNITHLAMALFASLAGIDMVHVPYKGAAPSIVALLSGEVQLLFSSIPAALPHITSGRIKALGVSISKRSSVLPNVPTIDEAGLKGYYAASWYGLLLPRGVPRDTVARLAQETGKIMRAPDIKERMMNQGFEPVGGTPEAFSRFIGEEIPRWERVVKAAGIKPQ
ncbi:MAG: tripartite tricarboxylate transporter receptor family protein [Burkholderiales bacterium]|jgi:tripartite-type tricarboxylate transporter receptor subunit TctC|nr:tripartite tricarboxylate transporter receptor family protein [Burkholderiales bacterium]